MPHSRAIVSDGQKRHQLDISDRDWGLLTGPLFDAGPPFVSSLGVYEHFTVARGVPKGSQVTRQRFRLLDATQSLLRAIQRDEDLLCSDYTFSFQTGGSHRTAGRSDGFHVRGLIGSIDTRPHGYCCLALSQLGAHQRSRVVELIDMRVRDSIETDDLGLLRIHRRKAETHWPRILPAFIDFLSSTDAKEITIEHFDRVV